MQEGMEPRFPTHEKQFYLSDGCYIQFHLDKVQCVKQNLKEHGKGSEAF